MILAECIVATDGTVEKVNLVSPSKSKKVNELAIQSLHRYRFKPATYKGNPVRFKSVEVLSF